MKQFAQEWKKKLLIVAKMPEQGTFIKYLYAGCIIFKTFAFPGTLTSLNQ